MDENPYQSPEPPEEQIEFRERGEIWRGWQKMLQVGRVAFFLSIVGAFGLGALDQVIGFKPNWYVSVAFIVAFGGSIFLMLLSLIGAYLNSVVLMFRDEYS